ncbi:uncharacterized protein LOC106417088 [Brassica napus]|uniref:uncharacterized protein LOC106417088 n=1 Tax=Brassica napus TaxID=3708 RepID=UPI002078D8B2|nr:uncharacterized protein LOC106417088 [Brassica napus]
MVMRDYRPIACCNVLYKVVSKIPANRLKKLLPSIISENQSAFIKGRLLMENVLLAAEMVKDYHKESISPRLCITSPSFSVQVNGELAGYFQNKAAMQKKFRLHPGCSSLSLTHLCFADDLMMFVERSKESVEGALAVFDEFVVWSGLKISIEKSTIYMVGVAVEEKARIKRNFPLAEGTLPVRYLGLPLMTQVMRRPDYQPLVEKIRCKMNTWTSRCLSYAGRMQLIKSVIMSIVNFWSAAFRLPSQCMKEVEQLCAAFLWSGPDLITSRAKVAWKEVCKQKDEGGLGIRDLKEVNLVCGLKLIWRLLSGKSLWSKWIKVNLMKKKSFWEVNQKNQNGSWMWRKLLKIREIAKGFYRTEVGNGRHTSFWFDCWNENGVLYDLLGARGFIDMGVCKEATVEDAISRSCRRRRYRTRMLNAVEESLNRVRDNISGDKEDVSLWRRGSGFKSSFSTSETWKIMRGDRVKLSTMDRVIHWNPGADDECVLWIMESSYTSSWSEIMRLAAEGCNMDRKRLFCFRYAFHIAIYGIWRERNRVRHGEKLMPITVLKKVTDKGVRNKLSVMRAKGVKGMEDALQLWFGTRV